MFSIRRYVVYFFLSAAFLLLLNHFFRQPQFSSTAYQDLDDRPLAQYNDDLPPTKNIPPFKWNALPTHFPIPAESLLQLPTAQPLKMPRIQHEFEAETATQATTRKTRQTAVKAAFTRCWDAYRSRAWMHDELSPLTGKVNDKFGGWGATLVDNLDTLWIMGLKPDFKEAVNAVLKIDTSAIAIETINVFETTIRHLGGLLAAYDLSGEKRLLAKAIEFGEMLLKPFDTPNHLPITRWSWESAARGIPQEGPEKILLAEIGTLSMEFTRLSQLSGDPKWYSAVHNISLLFESELASSDLPGMFPVTIGARQKLDVSKDNYFTLNGMADSFYEYLPKMYLLLGGAESVYKKLYDASMTTAIKHTIWRPMTKDKADILFSGAVRVTESGPKLTANVQHLGCFTGGMFTLGGKLFDYKEHFNIGKKLTNGCVWAYQATPLGVMTEQFHMVPCPEKTPCEWNQEVWRKGVADLIPDDTDVDTFIVQNRLRNGVAWFEDTKYHLRPEAIESVFLLYRMTGDTSLQDTAWEMFTAIMNVTTTALANAALHDVTYTHKQLEDAGSTGQFDSMESFWLAETLKYFYLIFSEPDLISLDEYVFNTEAHPFRRPSLG